MSHQKLLNKKFLLLIWMSDLSLNSIQKPQTVYQYNREYHHKLHHAILKKKQKRTQKYITVQISRYYFCFLHGIEQEKSTCSRDGDTFSSIHLDWTSPYTNFTATFLRKKKIQYGLPCWSRQRMQTHFRLFSCMQD